MHTDIFWVSWWGNSEPPKAWTDVPTPVKTHSPVYDMSYLSSKHPEEVRENATPPTNPFSLKTNQRIVMYFPRGSNPLFFVIVKLTLFTWQIVNRLPSTSDSITLIYPIYENWTNIIPSERPWGDIISLLGLSTRWSRKHKVSNRKLLWCHCKEYTR